MSHQPQQGPSGFFGHLGDFVARFRWLVVAVWIIFVGVSTIGARQVKGELVSGGINVEGSESNRGEIVLAEEFNRKPTRTAAAIFTSSRFVVTDPQYKDGVDQALEGRRLATIVQDVVMPTHGQYGGRLQSCSVAPSRGLRGVAQVER